MKNDEILNAVFGLLFATFLGFVFGVFKGYWLKSELDNIVGLLLFLLASGLVGLSLLVTMIALTVTNIKNKAPALSFLVLWGPTQLTIVVIGAILQFEAAKQEKFEVDHPNISEVHINLSGKPLWLTQPDTLLENFPDTYFETTRYAKEDLSEVKAYQGARLAASFKRVSLLTAQTPDTEQRTALTLPVMPPKFYPDVASFIPIIADSNDYGYKPTEAGLWLIQYYYYADRVEVVPAIKMSGSESMALWGSDVPLVNVHIANLLPQAIARVEVDGATLALSGPWPTESFQYQCGRRYYNNYVINPLNAPIKVRWQFAEANPQWHEATVTVPKLAAPKTKPEWKKREDHLFLFFQKDGSVATQWQQEVTFKGDKLGVRTSAIQPALLEPAPCGAAGEAWSDEVLRVAN